MAPNREPAGRGHYVVEPMTGIEPALSAWEAEVLPLNYIGVRLRAIDSLSDQALCHASLGMSALVPGPDRAWSSFTPYFRSGTAKSST